jgi:uncharacterized Zn-binding protein involved in type VI secretion
MGKPAARITDMHTCPMFDGPKPHVGGPIIPTCCPTVLIGGLPAARVSDKCTCVGPIDAIVQGSPTVFIGGLPAARIGDMTAHGGIIVSGMPTVLIGDAGGSAGGGAAAGAAAKKGDDAKAAAAAAQKKAIEQAKTDAKNILTKCLDGIKNKSDAVKSSAKKWFGDDNDDTLKLMQDRVEKEIKKLDSFTAANFVPAEPGEGDCYAYVYPDKDDKIYLGDDFEGAPATGPDSKASTLIHEMSHYNSVGGTDDVVLGNGKTAYGEANCMKLVKENPAGAKNNADSFENFVVESADN